MALTPSPAGTFNTPDQDESAQLDYWLAQLASQVEAKMLSQTTGARARVHVVTGLTATTDASGYATFAHGAPFTPRLVQVTIMRNAVSLAYLISCEVSGPSNVVARFGAWNTTNVLASASLGAGAIGLVCWE
jgi:hypothetical protein